jgi:hypothetical protein
MVALALMIAELKPLTLGMFGISISIGAGSPPFIANG